MKYPKLFVIFLVLTLATFSVINAQSKSAQDGIDSKLFEACRKGDDIAVKMALWSGANVNAQDSSGNTPLMIAAKTLHGSLIELLLRPETKAIIQNDNGENITEILGIPTAIQEKLEAKIVKEKALAEQLMQAIWDKNTSQALELLKAGAYIDFIDKSFKEHATPLMIALNKDNIELVKALVKAGARLERTDLYGATALFYATSKEAAEILFDAGANINSVNLEGHTPLHIAADKGDVEVVKFLLTKNVIVDKETKLQATELHYAANNVRSEIIAALLKAGADPNKKSDKGYTALMLVAGKGDLASTKLLLQNRADPNLTNNDGETALFLAQKYKQEKTAFAIALSLTTKEYFDGMKMPVSKMSEEETALFKAVAGKNRQKVAEILKTGVHQGKNEKGETALMIAADNDDIGTVTLLLDFGADINAQDYEGMTALMRAVAKDLLFSTEKLVKAGAKKDIKDKKGRTAYIIAKEVNKRLWAIYSDDLKN